MRMYDLHVEERKDTQAQRPLRLHRSVRVRGKRMQMVPLEQNCCLVYLRNAPLRQNAVQGMTDGEGRGVYRPYPATLGEDAYDACEKDGLRTGSLFAKRRGKRVGNHFLFESRK